MRRRNDEWFENENSSCSRCQVSTRTLIDPAGPLLLSPCRDNGDDDDVMMMIAFSLLGWWWWWCGYDNDDDNNDPTGPLLLSLDDDGDDVEADDDDNAFLLLGWWWGDVMSMGGKKLFETNFFLKQDNLRWMCHRSLYQSPYFHLNLPLDLRTIGIIKYFWIIKLHVLSFEIILGSSLTWIINDHICIW